MKIYSDKKVIKLMRSGLPRDHDRALYYLYRRQYPGIESFIIKHNGTELDAADVFQDALIVFFKQIRRGELQLDSHIGAYLYAICRNLWFRRLKLRLREVPLTEEQEQIPDSLDPMQYLMVDEKTKVLAGLVRKLGPGCRRLVKYYYYDRLKIKDIARLMKISSEQVAKNQKARCMQKLRALVQNNRHLRELFSKK